MMKKNKPIDFADYMRKAGMEMQRAQLSQTQQAIRTKLGQGSWVGAGTALYYGQPLTAGLIALPAGTSWAVAHMIRQPNRVFRQWLSEGAKEGLKVGGRVAIASQNEE